MAKKQKRKGWFARLVDMDDTTVSASTVFLIITSAVAIFLLLVPAVVLLVEVFHNHTIMTDLSGMGQYIMAVAGIFASGGILKGWTNYTNFRFNKKSPEEIEYRIQKQIKEDEAENEEQELDA